MKPKEFKDLVKQLPRLSAKQRASLRQVLEAPTQNVPQAVQEIEARMGNDPVCPRCGSHRIGKWGIAKGLLRFRCKECKRTFNALTGTPLAHLRKKECWDQFAACLQESKTVRGSAEECGVHRNTTFRWRHRFLAWINESKPPSLHGVVEADETFFLESQKGSRHLSRKPRKRGGKASKRGRSKEQICVLVARDRSGQTTDHILPAFNAEVVNLSAGERVRAKTIHLQNVNGYHSRLKGWIARFHGVSTRWLPNYLGWRRMLDGRDQALSPAVVLKSALRIIDFNTLR